METTPRVARRRASRPVFFGIAALLFVASAATTIVWSGSMSVTDRMPMPGGWTMSMAWMRMSGRSWPGAAASFLGMWIVMMVAMMLPSLVPMLWAYRQTVSGPGDTRPGRLTALVATGYFFVWAALGAAVFPIGVSLAALAIGRPDLARSAPIAAGAVVLMAGIFQFTPWKARRLACCRRSGRPECDLPRAVAAWRHGQRLGVHCACGCGGLMAIQLAVGVMDLRAMAVVTAAITLERVAPAGERIARATGAIAVAAGLLLVVRAAGLG